jgi:hypothetical protein
MPPLFQAYGGTAPVASIGDSSMTFNFSSNFNIYNLEGTIDTFGSVILYLSF